MIVLLIACLTLPPPPIVPERAALGEWDVHRGGGYPYKLSVLPGGRLRGESLDGSSPWGGSWRYEGGFLTIREERGAYRVRVGWQLMRGRGVELRRQAYTRAARRTGGEMSQVHAFKVYHSGKLVAECPVVVHDADAAIEAVTLGLAETVVGRATAADVLALLVKAREQARREGSSQPPGPLTFKAGPAIGICFNYRPR